MTETTVCGMTVDVATALHTERDGKTIYVCSDHYRKTFSQRPSVRNPMESLESWRE